MARMANKVAVIAGGTGVVGSGIVRAFLDEGATVIAPCRSAPGAERLKEACGEVSTEKLTSPILDVGKPSDMQTLVDQLKSTHGQIDHAVSSIGAWWQKGVISSVDLEEFSTQVHNLAGSHFVFYSHILPLIKDEPDSGYLFITGSAGEDIFVKESAMVTVGAACLFGISLAARAECADKKLRVNEMRICALIARNSEADGKRTYSTWLSGKLAADIMLSKKSGVVTRVGQKDMTLIGRGMFED